MKEDVRGAPRPRSRGRGVATHALAALLRIAFDELRLHRVQAAVMPRNTPSIRVVEKCGFALIGLSPRYLCINGVWEDHLLFATTVEQPVISTPAA